MKLKGILGLLISVVLISSFMTGIISVSAAGNMILKYGDFEEAKLENVPPIGWNHYQGWEDGFLTTKETAHKGEYSLKTVMKEDTKIGRATLGVSSFGEFSVGEEYVISIWINVPEDSNAVNPKLMIQAYSDETKASTITAYSPEKEMIDGNTNGEWVQLTLTFKPAIKENPLKRIFIASEEGTKGVIYWDDMQMVKKGEVVEEEKPFSLEEFVPAEIIKNQESGDLLPAIGSENLLQNGDFENGMNSWGTTKENNVKVTDKHSFSGKNSLIQGGEGDHYFARQNLAVDPGAGYQVAAWLDNRAAIEGQIAIRVEFYKEAPHSADNYLFVTGSGAIEKYNDGWQQVTYNFEAPENCTSITVYIRNLGSGVVFWDDVKCYKTKNPKNFSLKDEWTFYYTEWGTGNAFAEINRNVYEGTDGTIDFCIKDGDTVVGGQKTVMLTDGEAGYTFDLGILQEKKKEYTLEATLKNTEGAVIEVQTLPVYRYDRPTHINENGEFVDNGKVLDIKIVTSVKTPAVDFPDVAAMGMTVATGYAMGDIEGFGKVLDAAAANGLRVIGLLYSNMLPAGHPKNAEDTKKMVEKFKDHPAVFAWGIMDEPYLNLNNPDGWLSNSYKIIRDIDDKHPVWVVENDSKHFKDSMRYSDILGIDPYAGDSLPITTSTADDTVLGLKAVKGKKPVIALTQAFNYDGYYPTVNESRHFAYQTLIEGGKGVGYYKFKEVQGAYNLDDTELGKGIVQFLATEYDDALAYFSRNQYKTFHSYTADDVWIRSWVKDGSIYMVILDRDEKDSYKEPKIEDSKDLVIPLISDNGAVTIGDYKAELLKGGEPVSFTGSGTLNIKLKSRDALLYKLTPVVEINAEKLNGFSDLANFTWAADSINALSGKGMVNSTGEGTYSPAEKITRADFAMFLIRALKLNSVAANTKSFDDVDEAKYYAGEIAIGKELGILNGVGDNKFNPDAAISRQDMMTICARGMKYANLLSGKSGATAISRFSDKDLISDYALESIGQMVRDGIVLGNADGTVNPKGNTTRAEAAVIMKRISEK